MPPGPVLSQRDQALGALKALVQVLGLEKGSQVLGLVERLLPQKPASPVPTTPPMRRWCPLSRALRF